MKLLKLIFDILLVIGAAFWIIIILAAAFQRPAEMPEDYEDNIPEKTIFNKNQKL
ncbi:MAG TPA: hypothetical protein PLR11_02125 [Candidatus Paceibacterota bacterium]|nr:hypothetical protein [Candidatus Paceibacterota bacterium]